jgi:hypothetical protein
MVHIITIDVLSADKWRRTLWLTGGGACYLKLLLELRVKSALRWYIYAISGSDYIVKL